MSDSSDIKPRFIPGFSDPSLRNRLKKKVISKEESSTHETELAWKAFDAIKNDNIQQSGSNKSNFNNLNYPKRKFQSNTSNEYAPIPWEKSLEANLKFEHHRSSLLDDTKSRISSFNEEIEFKIKNWNILRELQYGLSGKVNNHSCNVKDCCEKDSICIIDEKLHLYGCLNSGNWHVCKNDSQTCPFTYTNKSGGIVCIFSGIELEMMITSQVRGIPITGVENGNGDGEYMNDYDENNYSVEMELEDVSYEEPSIPEHIPFHSLDYSQIKITGEDSDIESNGLEDKKSNITNRNFNDYDNDAKRKKRRVVSSKGYNKPLENLQKNKIHDCVWDLLYNKANIDKANEESRKNLFEKISKLLRKYYKECCRDRKEIPMRHRVDDIVEIELSKFKAIRYKQEDINRVNYYVKLCCIFWMIASKSPFVRDKKNKLHVRSHVLGVLYYLKMGIIVANKKSEKKVIIPEDTFLRDQLPNSSLLKFYSDSKAKEYEKKEQTRGINIIKSSLDSLKSLEDSSVYDNSILEIEKMGAFNPKLQYNSCY